MSGQAVVLDITDGVGHVTFNQAERGNPLDSEFCKDFCDIANECAANREVRAVLIDARGKYFSVGGDLKTLAKDQATLDRFVQTGTADLHMAIARFARMDAPVVTAVHALVAGGATALVAASDFALAGRSAKFYAAFAAIGLSCDTSSSYFYPRRLGSRRTLEFLLLNQTWSAEQAHAYGLINRVVDDAELAGEAMMLARTLAEGPTRAVGEIKRLLLSSYEQPLEAQLELEARAIARSARTADGWSGLSGMAAKRKPVFTGR